MNTHFKLSGKSLHKLKSALFSGDGKEAVALVLCGHVCNGEQVILLAHQVIPLTDDSYSIQNNHFVRWKTDELRPVLERAERDNLTVVKFHCHPSGYEKFSDIDNESDKALFPSIYDWLSHDVPCLSAILLPNDKIIIRHVDDAGNFLPASATVIGDEIVHHSATQEDHAPYEEFEKRNLQAFGSATRNILSKMKVAIIGCSGTGSPVIEQLNRLGVGTLINIDPDTVELKNLNRITNTKISDAHAEKFKVDAIADSLNAIGLPTRVISISKSIYDSEVIKQIATCDFIFGCVDSAEARVLMSRMSNFYLIPYIDIGICLDADGKGGVNNISGKVSYFQPGKSDHLSRKSVLPSTLEAETLKRVNPIEYKTLLDEGYIKGVVENSPAIIPVNTYASSMGVLEFLARIHDYRNEPNSDFAQQTFCLVNNFFEHKKESDFAESKMSDKYEGRGDLPLLLDMPVFSLIQEVA